MAEYLYNVAAKRAMDGDLDLNAPADLRVLLLTTDAENKDHANLAAIITAGAVEATHTGYARQSLSGDSTYMVLSPDSEFFDFFSAIEQEAVQGQ